MKIKSEKGVLTVWLEGRIDSENSEHVEEALLQALREHIPEKMVLDMEKLTYISSAGLRILLRCHKQIPSTLILENVRDEVYDILTLTGFEDLFEVHRALRDFTFPRGEKLADSVNGQIYSLPDDNMLKVFNRRTSLEEVKQERQYAHVALVNGIPTAIPYDVVKVADTYGIIYEAMDMTSLARMVTGTPELLQEYAEQFAGFLKQLHETPVKGSGLPDIKERYSRWMDLAGPRLKREEYQKLERLIREIPDRDTYVHGEINLTNVIVHRGEMMVMDMGGSGYGHPLIDLQGIYAALIKMEQEQPLYCSTYFGVSGKNCKLFWDHFLRTYMSGRSEKDLTVLQSLLEQYYILKKNLVAKLQGEFADADIM